MGSFIFLILQSVITAIGFVVNTTKAILQKWWGVDPVSTLLCAGMFALTLAMRNDWLVLSWIGAASCLSVAAFCNWQWSLLDDLQRIRTGGIGSILDRTARRRVEVVGARSDPAEKNEETQLASTRRVSTLLSGNIVGQAKAVEAVLSGLEAAAFGTRTDTARPLSFLMIGPTGVGKTETAKLTAQGLRRHFYAVPMENHKDEHELWQLLGSPQGYVGGEGMLTREVKNHPQTVLLFDELEKGASPMMDVFLRMLDEGVVRDNRTDFDVNFSRTTIFFTSNLITDVPADLSQNDLRTLVQKKGVLRPEFIARIGTIVPFYSFNEEDLHSITEFQLTSYLEQVCKKRRISPRLVIHRQAIELLVARQDPKFGARNVSSSIDQYVEPPLRKALLARGRGAIGTLSVESAQDEIAVSIT
jgi:ATP-dependent Clp protease ATP-binding subunit ClpA